MCRLSLKALISALAPIGAFALGAVAAPAFAAADNCLNVNGVGSRPTSAIVQYDLSSTTDPNTGNTTFTYFFTGLDPSTPSVNGVPGLITYCVYPDLGNLPTSVVVDPTALGANGDQFDAAIAAKGSFSFTRDDGNPSNIAFDGLLYTMGTATWNGTACFTDPITFVTTCSTTHPASQTILLHINDQAECDKLYGAGGSSTCWVFPTPISPQPPPSPCNGEPACKSAVIDEATGDFDANGYPIVPMFTLLHIHYTYVIVNQITNSYNMIFNAPTPKTQDINSGGGKDYFGCEQVPDPSGSPGAWGTYPNYQSTGFTFTFFSSNGNNCAQSRFTMVSPKPGPIVLAPGQSVSFTVDMITRTNKGGKQEFTSAGPHLLNSGFTIKWFQSNDNLLHSFTTGITPLYVDAQP